LTFQFTIRQLHRLELETKPGGERFDSLIAAGSIFPKVDRLDREPAFPR
jgi:hypothetical protein